MHLDESNEMKDDRLLMFEVVNAIGTITSHTL
jgi:hypothetical protein